MIVVIAALVVGYWLAGPVGTAIGGGIVMMLALWTKLSTPKEHRESLHETLMRTNQTYRDAHLGLVSGRKPLERPQELIDDGYPKPARIGLGGLRRRITSSRLGLRG